MNTTGYIFRVTDFGESHGEALGGVVDGMPAGVKVDFEKIAAAMRRRRPGQSELTTQRNEADDVEFLSGIFEGITTGAPIGFIIRNRNQRPADYGNLSEALRPNHADYTYLAKYGVRDYRGGGRSSARETAVRVAAGALAMQALEGLGVEIKAYTERIGRVVLDMNHDELDLDAAENNPVRCPDALTAERMEAEIKHARAEGDSLGGVVRCVVTGCPPGLGEPVFGKLQSRLAGAMLTINAAKGFDYGGGFHMAGMRGSEVADSFYMDENGRMRTRTNHSGGIQGGISNGEDITFRVAFKPVATLTRPLDTVDIHGASVHVEVKGRHDPCVVPRAVAVVEAMAAIVLLDCYLENKSRL